MIKTYSIAMMKQHGLELVKGLPVMTLGKLKRLCNCLLTQDCKAFVSLM